MEIHVDTEFTSLSDPRLIAIGAVAGDSRAFYGIVSDFPKRACTRFVIEHVLPALGANPADAPLPHDALARAFCDWLAELATSGNGSCRLIMDDECDRELVARLLLRGDWSDADIDAAISQRRLSAEDNSLHRFERYFDLNPERCRHNALDDARAYCYALASQSGASSSCGDEHTGIPSPSSPHSCGRF